MATETKYAGEIEIDQFSQTQWHVEVRNAAAQSFTNIVLDTDALEEFRDLLTRIIEGDLPAATFQVDCVGASF